MGSAHQGQDSLEVLKMQFNLVCCEAGEGTYLAASHTTRYVPYFCRPVSDECPKLERTHESSSYFLFHRAICQTPVVAYLPASLESS